MLTPGEARAIARRAAAARPPRWLTALLAAGIAAGIAGFALGLAGPAPGRAWQVAFVNLLFFAGWAQAGVAFSAVLRLTRARWGLPMVRLAESGLFFAAAAPLGLALLLLGGGRAVMPWLDHPRPELGRWLARPFVVAREIAAWAAIAGAGAAFVAASLQRDLAGAAGVDRRLDRLAVLVLLAFTLGLSLTAFDLIMPLEPRWHSALIGGHLFMSTLYLGVAGLAIAVRLAARPLGLAAALDSQRYHDLGKLLAALALFTTYLFYSQFLPIWYGNLRDETSFVMPRLYAAPWRGVALAVLGAAYLGPFVLLLPASTKRRPTALAAVALLAAAGLWLERFLLVVPSLWGRPSLPLGPLEGAVTLGFLAAFAASALAFLRRFPVLPVEEPRLYEQPSEGP